MKSIDQENWLTKRVGRWIKLTGKEMLFMKKVDWQRQSIDEESWLWWQNYGQRDRQCLLLIW